MLAGAGCLKPRFLPVICSTAQKHVQKDPISCMNYELQAVTLEEMSNPHLSMLPILDFIH